MQELKEDALVWVKQGNYKCTGTITKVKIDFDGQVTYRVSARGHYFDVLPEQIQPTRQG